MRKTRVRETPVSSVVRSDLIDVVIGRTNAHLIDPRTALVARFYQSDGEDGWGPARYFDLPVGTVTEAERLATRVQPLEWELIAVVAPGHPLTREVT